ncbi:MAG: trypsin-like peptidase domain-containing protein [Nanoarchaeota archaeon]|nr:trypsin-like peptidase domain-containing protein [Nanoarchaeota archaeon]
MSSESQIIKTVQKVMPAVVSIVVSKKAEDVERDLRREDPKHLQPGAKIPKENIDPRGFVQVGGGSGSIVEKKGVILTNKHVINEPFATYSVITAEGIEFPAKILARDPVDDIAILKINPGRKNLPTVTLGNSDEVRLGESVLAFGNALGIFKSTVSRGIVSGLGRAIEAKENPEGRAQEMRGLIQTDAAINPGNSGGPLTDIKGNVIGINAAVISGAQNIGFAIPIKAAERDLADVKKYGKIKRPLLGIRYITLTPNTKETLHLPVDYGALVTKENPMSIAVAAGGPADKAGIKEQDIILEWNKTPVTKEKTIHDFLEDAKVGEVVQVKVLRGKSQFNTTITLTERR